MKVAFTMQDDQGIIGVFIAEGEWLAFDLDHAKDMEDFKPRNLTKIEIGYDNGNSYMYPYWG